MLPRAGWAVVLPLLAVAAARLVAWDARSSLVGLNAVIPLLFLPAWPSAARGRPFQVTWPRDLRVVPPLTRIDHVLTTAVLTVTAIRTGRGRGSDHRPLIADVARTGTGSADDGPG